MERAYFEQHNVYSTSVTGDQYCALQERGLCNPAYLLQLVYIINQVCYSCILGLWNKIRLHTLRS